MPFSFSLCVFAFVVVVVLLLFSELVFLACFVVVVVLVGVVVLCFQFSKVVAVGAFLACFVSWWCVSLFRGFQLFVACLCAFVGVFCGVVVVVALFAFTYERLILQTNVRGGGCQNRPKYMVQILISEKIFEKTKNSGCLVVFRCP